VYEVAKVPGDVCPRGDEIVLSFNKPVEQGRRSAGAEQGFALILAILALMLLTFLGLTLATTTSQELQISTNYRWAQQALYNAEAGMEAGRALLANVNWDDHLPAARTITWLSTTPAPGAKRTDDSPTGRDYENGECDQRAQGTGFGKVLHIGSDRYENRTEFMDRALNGSATIWIRRKIATNNEGVFNDSTDNESLIITVEGVAPYVAGDTGSSVAKTYRASKLLEFDYSREPTKLDPCGTRAGQAGAGPEGSNFGGCVAIDDDRVAEGLGRGKGTVSDTGAQ
jgi:hypothetical protein